MNPGDDMRDLAAAYVLNALDADEQAAFEAELARSEALQREVAQLREVAGLLALGAPSVPRDDDALKAKLLHRIRGGRAAPAHRKRLWTGATGWAVAAALLMLLAVEEWRVRSTEERVAEAGQLLDSLNARLAQREVILARILGSRTSIIHLTTNEARAPAVQLFWNREARAVVLSADNLPPAAEGRAYQLWFLGEGAPIPGGTFNTTGDGTALITLDGPPPGETFRGAAITEEPAGGSQAPTSAIIVSGFGSD